MDILIDVVRISGFRGIENVEVTLPRVAVLIGPNNAGKTSFLKALQIALGDYYRFISEEDFYIGEGEKRATEIVVDVRIVASDAENGARTKEFSSSWIGIFGDSIKAEAAGKQYVSIRTRLKPDKVRGGFDLKRYTLEFWPQYDKWLTERIKETKLLARYENIPFISIDAQRDLKQDLRDHTSFASKIFKQIEYDTQDTKEIEEKINTVNSATVEKSKKLKKLKDHLENLNKTFEGAGKAEITPFPKKLRDLSKNISIHVGEDDESSFSMEYHGMGTRSWATLLSVKAFVEIHAESHAEEVEPYFPILAIEEPEAHLHPNAQKTLYRQLSEFGGQVIFSTHSPYIASMADVMDIRSFYKQKKKIDVHKFLYTVGKNEKKIFQREIMFRRSEILFAKVLLLSEGVTEEQVLPAMFFKYTGKTFDELGICCVSVGGKNNYSQYIKLAYSLGIPVHILSDNDGTTKNDVNAQIRRLKMKDKLNLDDNKKFKIEYLPENSDFEKTLLDYGLKDEVINSYVDHCVKDSEIVRFRNAIFKEIKELTYDELLKKIRDNKASYSGYLADVILENPANKEPVKLLPDAVRITFDNIKEWLS